MTHLREVIIAADPESVGFRRVIVWGSRSTLAGFPNYSWLDLRHEPALDGTAFHRERWRRMTLDWRAKEVDVLFVPGSLYRGSYKPFVTISQNLLPFDLDEVARYPVTSWVRARLWLLRRWQTATFKKAAGVIFLTETARAVIEQFTGALESGVAIVPHGVAERYRREPRPQRQIENCSAEYPMRVLYVSALAPYKNQESLVRAIAQLRREGVPLALDLVGPGSKKRSQQLMQCIAAVDPGGDFIKYSGAIEYAKLDERYHQADIFAFPSGCENMPIILVEAMASGLPIASSDRGPMPEILGEAGVYFDPSESVSIASAIKELALDPDLRGGLAKAAYQRAEKYTWARCARETFDFLATVARGTVHAQASEYCRPSGIT